MNSMASIYQRLLIVLFLLIAFAGRVAVYAITTPKSQQEVLKENGNKTNKSCASESNEQLEEKLKLEDLAINRIFNTAFLNITRSKTVLFASDYKLLMRSPQTLEYPPK